MLKKRQNESLAFPDKLDRPFIISVEDFPKLVKKCESSNRDVAYQAVFNILIYVRSKHELFLDQFLEPNLVDALVNHIVNGQTEDVKYNAAWILSEIASGDSKYLTFLVQDTAVIRALSSLLCHTNPYLVEQSICALSNIIGNGSTPIELVLSSNILAALNQPLNQHFKSIPVMKKLSWMLINICCKKDEDVPIEYVPQIIRLLNVLIVHKDEYILADVLSALFCLTDSSCDHVSLIIASGMVDKIYTFLEASEKLILKALSVLCNIAGSTDEHIQYLLDNGIIIHIRPLLMTKNEKIKQEIYWILSNFAAGTRSQMLTLFSLNIFPQIIQDLKEGIFGVKRQACWIIANIVHSGTYQDVQPFVDEKALFSMRNALQTPEPELTAHVLEVLLILLKIYSNNNDQESMRQKIIESGVLECIQNLQSSSDKSIRLLSIYLLQNYFEDNGKKDVLDDKISSSDQSDYSDE